MCEISKALLTIICVIKWKFEVRFFDGSFIKAIIEGEIVVRITQIVFKVFLRYSEWQSWSLNLSILNTNFKEIIYFVQKRLQTSAHNVLECRTKVKSCFYMVKCAKIQHLSFAGGFAGTPSLAVGLFYTCILQGASQAQGPCCTNPKLEHSWQWAWTLIFRIQ